MEKRNDFLILSEFFYFQAYDNILNWMYPMWKMKSTKFSSSVSLC